MLVAGESIPLQVSLIEAEAFFRAGAFDPTITGVEDRDLGRRLALIGDIAFTDDLVAQIRTGEQGSTTDWNRIAEDDRWGREKALSHLNAFECLRASTNSSYLHGRVSRAYFASAVWNMKNKNLYTAISRLFTGCYFTGVHTFRKEFWRGLRYRFK